MFERKLQDHKQELKEVFKINLYELISTQQKALPSSNRGTEYVKLALSDHKGTSIISTKDILYCKAENRYTRFYFSGQDEKLICKHLGEYENLLCRFPDFFRVNKSYIINIQYITGIMKSAGGSVLMSDNGIIPISKDRKDTLLLLLRDFIIDL